MTHHPTKPETQKPNPKTQNIKSKNPQTPKTAHSTQHSPAQQCQHQRQRQRYTSGARPTRRQKNTGICRSGTSRRSSTPARATTRPKCGWWCRRRCSLATMWVCWVIFKREQTYILIFIHIFILLKMKDKDQNEKTRTRTNKKAEGHLNPPHMLFAQKWHICQKHHLLMHIIFLAIT